MYSGSVPLERLRWIHTPHPELVLPLTVASNCGMYSNEDAKITGITPAMLTFSGI